MKKRFIIVLIALALAALPVVSLFGKDLPPYNNRLYSTTNGATVHQGSSAIVQVAPEPWQGNFTDETVKDVLTFGVDQTYSQYFGTAMDVTVTLEIQRWGTSGAQTSFSQDMHIHYDPFNSNAIYLDKQTYTFTDAYKVQFTVTSIVVNGGAPQYTLPANLYIDGTIFVTRWFTFTGSAPSITTLQIGPQPPDCYQEDHEINIVWDVMPDAEEYQLEWTFINDYHDDQNGYINPTLLTCDFRSNATRITTIDNSYTIPLLFEHGWLVCRVRTLGRTELAPHLVLYGDWSLDDNPGPISGINNKLWIDAAHESGKNWQLTTTFAEEGKKKDVISYFDGSLRNRETVTELNTDYNTIVGQTIYDYQGRPAITVLPVPIDVCVAGVQPPIKYYNKFNQNTSFNGNSYLYSKDNFDTDNDPCGAQAEPMSTLPSGASHYYSADNPDQDGCQAFVPDAQQYPFSEVEYTPDNTGRIRRQGGVGPQFQLGSGHETFYYYGKPQQLEVDRLFGSEAGDASHYQKNFVIDPNNQISASYLDQEGRVIATSLSGEAGIGLAELPSAASATVELTSDLFDKDANGQSILDTININGTGIEFISQLLVGYYSNYAFSYNLVIDTLYDPCLAKNICFNCVYDLKIKVVDECGATVAEHTATVGYFSVDNAGHITLVFDCHAPSTKFSYPHSFSASLYPGNYTISKTLMINKEAEDTIIHAYLNPDFNSCVKTLDDFVNDALAHLDTSSCHITCLSCIQGLGSRDSFVALGYGSALKYDFLAEECMKPCQPTSWCEANYQTMLLDVSPDGQYGEYHDTTWVINPGLFPLSVFNATPNQPNHLPGTPYANWRYPSVNIFNTDYGCYIDDDGDSSIILLSGDPGNGFQPSVVNLARCHFSNTYNSYFTYPDNLANLADFILAWKPSWARSLLKYHPEYCYYKNCKMDAQVVAQGDLFTGDGFDAILENANVYNDAYNSNLISHNFNNSTPPIQRITSWWLHSNTVYDPFMYYTAAQILNGQSDTYNSDLHNRMSNYITVNNTPLDIVSYATYLARYEGIPNQYNPNCGNCAKFGDVIPGNPHLTDSLRDKEWTYLKALYLGLKREFQFMRANNFSVGCGGYNGCIGQTDWSPNGTPMAPGNCLPISTCPFYYSVTQTQPCSQSNYQYYWDKQRRFVDPALLPPGLSNANQISYQYDVLTGQCPLAATFQNLLSELALGGHLNASNYSMNNSPAFTGFFQYLYNAMPVAPNNYTWTGTAVGNDVINFVIKKDLTLLYSGTLDKSGTGILWSNIKIFSDLHVYSYTNGYSYFSVKAGVYTAPNSMYPYQYYLFSNSTNKINLDIFNCTFSPVSTANEFAVDIGILMSALAASPTHDLMNQSPNGIALSGYSAYVSASILNWLGVNSLLNLNWRYNSLSLRFEINAPNSKSIYIYISGFEPSNFAIANLINVIYFNHMVCDNYNYFRLDGYDSPNHLYVVMKGYVTLKTNSGESPISTGNVGTPISVLCNDPVYKTTTSFFQVLTDILTNQNLYTFKNFFSDPFMTTELATLFFPNTQTSNQYIVDQTGSDFFDTLKFHSSCPFMLTHSNSLSASPALYMDNIISIQDIVLTGTPDDEGNYRSFYLIAQFSSGLNVYTDTVFGSVCIPLRICGCDDNSGIPTLPSMASFASSDSTSGEQTPYLTEISGAKSILDVDSSYAKYTSAVDIVNSEIVDPSDTIAPLSENDFFAGGYAYSTESYKKYAEHFHSEIDSLQYAKDIQSFAVGYGNNTQADKEHDRYVEAVKYYNEYSQQNGFDALTIMSDSEFYNGLYADTIYTYIDYLMETVKNGDEAVSITEFYDTDSSGLAYDDCEGEYKNYANAYYFFSNWQRQNKKCEKWELISPFISYEVFLKLNLCCSQLGQSLLNDYIETLYDTTQCPGPMPSLDKCDTAAQAKMASAPDCQSYYQDYVRLIDQYNVSYYATTTSHYLTIYYNTYDAFVAARLCDCYPLYLKYLTPYLTTTNLQLAAPLAIAVFCNSGAPPPDPCVSAYNDYSMAVNAYNSFALHNHYPVAPVYSYDQMQTKGYCDCINGFIKFLQNIQLHFIANTPTLGSDINNYFVNCAASLTPPCPETLLDNPYFSPPFPNDTDPCIDQLIKTAIYNATNDYHNYRDSLLGVIANNYVTHCLHAFESFDATYNFKEYHFTLYYYDQAGNLVKTVPPEGVEQLAVTSSYDPLEQQIISDRTFHTHTIFTSHRLYTLYDYNSLNQLVKQSLPDHDKMNIFDPEIPFGINPNVQVTAIQFVSESRGYLSGFIDFGGGLKRGYFYTTTDGGHTWKFNPTVPGSNLKKIAWLSSTEGYAVGSDGTFIKTTDAGQNWDLVNTYLFNNNNYTAVYDFNDLYINGSTIYLAGKHGVILQFSSGNNTYSPVSAGQNNTDEITSITYDNSGGNHYLYFTAIENYTNTYPSRASKILYLDLDNSTNNGVVPLYPNFPWKVRYVNGTAYAVGLNGSIEKRVDVGSGNYCWITIPSKIKRNFRDIDFITDNIGIALIDSTPGYIAPNNFGQFYRTLDGGVTWTLVSKPGRYYNSMCVFNSSSAIHKVVGVGKYKYWVNQNTYIWKGAVSKISYFPDSSYGLIELSDLDHEATVLYASEHGTKLLVLAEDANFLWYNKNANYLSSGWGTSGFSAGIKTIAAKDFSTGSGFTVSGILVFNDAHIIGFRFISGNSDVWTPPGTILPTLTHVTDAATDFANGKVILYDSSIPKYYFVNLQSGVAPTAATALGFTNGSVTFSPDHIDAYNANIVGVISSGNPQDKFIKGSVNYGAQQITTSDETNKIRSAPLHDIQFSGTTGLFAAGNDGTIFMRATDHFEQLWCASSSNINSIKPIDNSNGFIVNDSGAVCKFQRNNDLDSHLSLVDGANHQPLYDIALQSNTLPAAAYAVGANGIIRYASNLQLAPTTFSSLLVTNPFNLYGIVFNGNNAWIVGDHARIHEAAGTNQMQIPNVFVQTIQSFHFTDEDNGYLVSDNFNIRQTHDAGATWKIAIPDPAQPGFTSYPTLLKIKTRDAGFAYVAGLNHKYFQVTDLTASSATLTLNNISATADILDMGLSSYDHTLKYLLVREGSSNSSPGHFMQLNGGNWVDKENYQTKNFTALWVFKNDNVALAGTNNLLEFYDGANFTSTYPAYDNDHPTYWPQQGINFTAITFYDDINGYAAAEHGFFIKSKDWRIDNGPPFSIHPPNTGQWEHKPMINDLNGQSDSAFITIRAIATPGRFWLMTGGSYNGTPVGYARLTHDESIVYSTRFWYDRVGRLILSQNTKQFNQDPKQYSYSLYDFLGRIIEAGVKSENPNGQPQFTSIFGAWVSNYYNTNVIDDAKLNSWINVNPEDTRSEVTRTFYDDIIPGLSIADFTQDNLRKRIASVTYSDAYKADPLQYNYATHYSYDIHGNVKTLVQDNPYTDVASQQYKRMDYDYDLISGKVNKVFYQKDQPDEWDHRYTYDADNRIKTEETSDNQVMWDQDAKYFYYQHGPLARTEIGNSQVQGIDYAYNLQGWIKGINSTTLDANRDIGQDGLSPSVNSAFAPDAFSYSLGYFTGDYQPIDFSDKWNDVTSRFVSESSNSDMLDFRHDLFNGNISYMMTTITNPFTDDKLPQATSYNYDQLNRLLEEAAFISIDPNGNLWKQGNPFDYRYYNHFSYDANGNILTQQRYDQSGNAIENLVYHYHLNDAQRTVQNRLYMVTDDVDPNSYPDDIDDQGIFDNSDQFVNDHNNYSYTELGELKKDLQEDIAGIVWRTDGKIKEVNRTANSPKKNLKFDYDPMGNRIAKHVYTSANIWESSTYYVRDAQGNIMATYSKTAPSNTLSYKLIERYIYGSSRVGLLSSDLEMIDAILPDHIRSHFLGKREYEGVNHLGNVLTVFSDKKIPLNNGGNVSGYKADLFTSQDYYPFGVIMQGRNFSSNEYRFGFQGQEMENDFFGEGSEASFKYRVQDTRLGRFLSVDPLSRKYPYNSSYAFQENKIGSGVEFEGLELSPAKDWGSDEPWRESKNRPAETPGEKAVQTFVLGGFAAVLGLVVLPEAAYTYLAEYGPTMLRTGALVGTVNGAVAKIQGESTFEVANAIVSGFVGGAALGMGGTSWLSFIGKGSIAGAIEDYTSQVIDNDFGDGSGYDFKSIITSAGVGGAANLVSGKLVEAVGEFVNQKVAQSLAKTETDAYKEMIKQAIRADNPSMTNNQVNKAANTTITQIQSLIKKQGTQAQAVLTKLIESNKEIITKQVSKKAKGPQ